MRTSIAVTLTCLAVVIFSSATAAADSRDIVVVVTLQMEDGTPLAEYPVSLRVPMTIGYEFSPPGQVVASAVTDERGSAVLMAQMDVRIDAVHIMLAGGGVESELSLDRRRELSSRVQSLRERASVPDVVRLQLEPDRSEYTTRFTVYRSVAVTGLVVGESDEPIGNLVYGPWFFQHADAKGRRQFRISGLRKNADTTLLAVGMYVDHVAPVLPIYLTNEQMQNDVDLGRIVIPDMTRDTELEVRLRNLDVVPSTSAGVTFIRSDGKIMFAAPAFHGQHERAGELSGNPIRLPAGEYFLAPGNASFLPRAEVWGLIEAIRQQQNIDEFEVPKIKLTKGDRYTVTFDLAEVQKTIRALMGE